MNRYKIEKKTYPLVKLFLAGKAFKKDVPSYAAKFRDQLSFKGNKLLYNGTPVIPVEDVDKYLRKQFYSKKSDLPPSRDGAWHLLKKRNVQGITRTRLMKFLKAQSPIESTYNPSSTRSRWGSSKSIPF